MRCLDEVRSLFRNAIESRGQVGADLQRENGRIDDAHIGGVVHNQMCVDHTWTTIPTTGQRRT